MPSKFTSGNNHSSLSVLGMVPKAFFAEFKFSNWYVRLLLLQIGKQIQRINNFPGHVVAEAI